MFVFLYTIVYNGCAQLLVMMCANCTETSVSREFFTRFESFFIDLESSFIDLILDLIVYLIVDLDRWPRLLNSNRFSLTSNHFLLTWLLTRLLTWLFDEIKDQVNKKRFKVDEKTIQVNQFEFKDKVNDQVKDKIND